ncbi:hypothetical protein [Bacillus sp. ISL-57]|uniref:hypothetical protein n=1 Tax=Bacillus sp. ISL-57 TaxID=2819135 RepID=UPI001BECA60E|nr:hypothetical protein [Bacillus sp. ISL-57]MBT2714727.1 hypothetical protein [Bacillus sp. ISL-57]
MFVNELLFEENGLQGWNEGPTGDHRRLVIRKDGNLILDIKVSGTAIADAYSGVTEENALEWLWSNGLRYIDSNPSARFSDILITSYSVKNGEITSDWSSLVREVHK